MVIQSPLYDKLHNGDEVDVTYREQFAVTYDKNKEGKKEVIARVLTRYDFLDAVPKVSRPLKQGE